MKEEKYTRNHLWDIPIHYKDYLIYPVTVMDSDLFLMSLQCLTLPKNRSKDIKIIKMDYLDYLFYLAKSTKEYEIYLVFLAIFLGVAFKGYTVDYVESNGKNVISITDPEDKLKKPLLIDGFELEQVKDIILKQNKVELDEPLLDKNLEDELKRAKRLKESFNDNESADLEELVVFLMVYWKMPIEEIKKMSLRKFNIALDRIVLFEDYVIYKPLETSGECEFKEPVRHYLNKVKKKDKYSDVKMSTKSIQNKLGDVAEFK